MVKIPEYVPDGFRFEADQERFTIFFRRPHLPFLVGSVLATIFVASQLAQVPTAFSRFMASKQAIIWSWSYPENLVWLGPLGFALFLMAMSFSAYAFFAAGINQQVLILTPGELLRFEQPLPLSQKQRVNWADIQSILVKKHTSGAGIATSNMFHVVLELKDGQTLALQSYHRMAEAECVADMLNHFFWQQYFSDSLKEQEP